MEVVSAHNAWVFFKGKGYINLFGSLAYVLRENSHILSLNWKAWSNLETTLYKLEWVGWTHSSSRGLFIIMCPRILLASKEPVPGNTVLVYGTADWMLIIKYFFFVEKVLLSEEGSPSWRGTLEHWGGKVREHLLFMDVQKLFESINHKHNCCNSVRVYLFLKFKGRRVNILSNRKSENGEGWHPLNLFC